MKVEFSENQNMNTEQVPAGEMKQCVAGIVLGAVGIAAALLSPIVGIILAIVGIVIMGKKKTVQKTKIGMILCIIAIVVGVGNAVLGTMMIMSAMQQG